MLLSKVLAYILHQLQLQRIGSQIYQSQSEMNLVNIYSCLINFVRNVTHCFALILYHTKKIKEKQTLLMHGEDVQLPLSPFDTVISLESLSDENSSSFDSVTSLKSLFDENSSSAKTTTYHAEKDEPDSRAKK